jgi:starvation-inducible DNA-binding protein
MIIAIDKELIMAKKLLKDLHIILANNYALYLKTQNYHWNVTGQEFKTLHLLFQEQYEAMALSIDEVAERIRMLGEKVPGSFKSFDAVKTIKDANEHATSKVMIEDLCLDHNIIIKILKKVVIDAQKLGDEVTVSLLIDLIAAHEKNSWMLKSSLI